MILLLATLVLLRSPGFLFGVVDIDETDFLVVGQRIRMGGIPYVDTVEQKPLFLYLFYAFGGLFGFDVRPMQVLGLLWLFATCLIVGAAARRLAESPHAGIAGAWLCALASSCNLLSVNAELMLNLPSAAALYFFIRAERQRRKALYFPAGLCIAFASLFKHQGGILLLALGAALFWRAVRARRLPAAELLLLGVGFALPWAAVAGTYAALGHFGAFLEWNVERNLVLSASHIGSRGLRLGQGLLGFVLLATPVQWWLAIRETIRAWRDPDFVRRGLAWCLWLTWIPVSLGGRFYGHYFLQFVPPLTILAGAAGARLLERRPALGAGARRALALGLLVPTAGFLGVGLARGLLGRYPCQEPRTREATAWLRANTPEGSRLFVWGHYTPIYYLAQRLPGTRYHNTSVHMGDFDPAHLPPGFDLAPYRSKRDIATTLVDLETNRPEYVVDTSPADIHHWSKIPLSGFPTLAAYVAAHYVEVARPGGVVVYQRKP